MGIKQAMLELVRRPDAANALPALLHDHSATLVTAYQYRCPSPQIASRETSQGHRLTLASERELHIPAQISACITRMADRHWLDGATEGDTPGRYDVLIRFERSEDAPAGLMDVFLIRHGKRGRGTFSERIEAALPRQLARLARRTRHELLLLELGERCLLLEEYLATYAADAIDIEPNGRLRWTTPVARADFTQLFNLLFSPAIERQTLAGSTEAWTSLFGLTSRECEVLEALCGGASNDAIARRLFISEGTVRTHLTRIYAKLKVRSRAEAIVAARG